MPGSRHSRKGFSKHVLSPMGGTDTADGHTHLEAHGGGREHLGSPLCWPEGDAGSRELGVQPGMRLNLA